MSRRSSVHPTRPVAPGSHSSWLPARLGHKPGLVLDWTTLNSGQSNYVFQGDTTYYISGTVTLAGSNVLEGGAVLRHQPPPVRR
jgi:hypothetical protein